jgi:LuxR family maltose regulon positive regulatory protein
VYGTPDADAEDAVVLSRQAVEWERAAGGDHPMMVTALGTALARTGRFAEAAPILAEAWNARDGGAWSSAVTLQIAGVLAVCLVELGRDDELEALLGEAEPLARDAERTWGPAAHPLVALMRIVQGLRLYRRRATDEARDALVLAVGLSESVARPTTRVLALVALADAHLGCGDRTAARSALRRAREIVDEEPPTPFAITRLEAAEGRIGRTATRVARRSGNLVEDLTDRELSVLRALGGTATQREIGAALFLSINTVKAYTKSLYRKLGVASRHDAVVAGRQLGLI